MRTVLGLVLAPVGRGVVSLLTLILLLPIALAVGLFVVLVDGAATPFVVVARSLRKRKNQPPASKEASIIVVSWNGKEFLERLLPSLEEAIRVAGGQHEVIVVDNGSQDDSIAYMRSSFPWVKIVALPENRFFIRGNMAGVREATRDVLVFLNNDMVVKPDFLRPLLEGFDHEDVFAVTSEVFFRDPNKRREETGKTSGRFHGGFLQLSHDLPNEDDARVDYSPTFWAGGGSSAFDRRKFLEVGGFDTIYDPFYLEDTGVSYQGWKRGWRLVFTPRSGVYHEHRGTSAKVFGHDYINNVIRRNQYLFIWRNVTDARHTLHHFLRVPYNVLKFARQSDKPFAKGILFEMRALLRAAPRLPLALWKREITRPCYRRSDDEVFALANHLHRYQEETGGKAHRPAGEGLRILMLCGRLPRLNTDGSWILHNLIRELGARHRITLFSWIDSLDEEEQAKELEPYCERVIVHVRDQNGAVLDLHHRVPYRLARDYSSPHMERAVRDILRRSDYDLVQVEYSEMAHMVHEQLAGLPCVYTCHEPLNLFHERAMERAKGMGQRARRGFEWAKNLDYEMRFTSAFQHVVTLSDVDQSNLHAFLPDLPVTTIPSGVNTELFVPTPDVAEEDIITFVGYFRHPPNVDGALWLAREVYPLVRAEHPTARLMLVGKDPTAEVHALAELPGVEVTGFVPDVRPYLSRSAVVAVPIRLGGGLRGKVLEAWSAGKAVVGTTRACEGFDIEHERNVLVGDSTATFARGLLRCLSDADLRRRLGTEGRRLALERYSTAAMARGYEAVYRKILGLAEDFEFEAGSPERREARSVPAVPREVTT
ncbi:MAG: glycosyltransferase [Planctomycetes bacterium]|nr:glycosyltransferase [Planctomycetota bacterium]